MNINKTILITLLFPVALSCAGNKGETAKTNDCCDSAVSATDPDQLVFERDSVGKSFTEKALFIDEWAGDDAKGEVIDYSHRWEFSAQYAVGGKPEAVKFINQWISLQFMGDLGYDPEFNADAVAKAYAEIEAFGVKDVKSVLRMCIELREDYDNEPEDGEQYFRVYGRDDEVGKDVFVAYNSPHLLTMGTGYRVYDGGARAGMETKYTTFDLNELRSLTLDDVITSDESARMELLEKAQKDLKKQGYEDISDEFTEKGFYECQFAFLPDGFKLIFSTIYVSAPDADPASVKIPYKQMDKYLTEKVKKLK